MSSDEKTPPEQTFTLDDYMVFSNCCEATKQAFENHIQNCYQKKCPECKSIPARLIDIGELLFRLEDFLKRCVDFGGLKVTFDKVDFDDLDSEVLDIRSSEGFTCETCGGEIEEMKEFNLDEQGIAWHAEGDKDCLRNLKDRENNNDN